MKKIGGTKLWVLCMVASLGCAQVVSGPVSDEPVDSVPAEDGGACPFNGWTVKVWYRAVERPLFEQYTFQRSESAEMSAFLALRAGWDSVSRIEVQNHHCSADGPRDGAPAYCATEVLSPPRGLGGMSLGGRPPAGEGRGQGAAPLGSARDPQRVVTRYANRQGFATAARLGAASSMVATLAHDGVN